MGFKLLLDRQWLCWLDVHGAPVFTIRFAQGIMRAPSLFLYFDDVAWLFMHH